MKFFSLLILLGTILFGADEELRLESNIYYTITKELSGKTRPKIYMKSSVASIQHYSSKFNIVNRCDDADVVLVSYQKDISPECEKKVLFGTRYQTLLKEPTVGAFFWQKGRPNILFYKSRLQKQSIRLSKDFQKYIDNEK